MDYELKIETISPMCLGSGKADINVDMDIVHDQYGLPYFPGKRLRGLLYESAVEVVEMANLCQVPFIRKQTVDELFSHVEADVELTVPNMYLEGYSEMKQEWQYLEHKYPDIIRPESVLAAYSSIRFQTAIDEDGITKDTSLRNIRVMHAGITFTGTLELCNAQPEHEQALALAVRNLRRAGINRNRGFGKFSCHLKNEQSLLDAVLEQKGGK